MRIQRNVGTREELTSPLTQLRIERIAFEVCQVLLDEPLVELGDENFSIEAHLLLRRALQVGIQKTQLMLAEFQNALLANDENSADKRVFHEKKF